MRDRRSVLMLMYDLPSVSTNDRREYVRFRKAMLHEGFIQLQESVYVRLYRNYASVSTDMQRIRMIAPQGGMVHLLPMPLNSFRELTAVRGENFDMSVFCDELLWF